jgi:aspartate/methionine/tyrosine aminotransferase
MAGGGRINGTRLNPAVFGMADYTLRRTDVNAAVERAKKLARPDILDARLGDPTVFGLGPFAGYRLHVERAMRDPKAWSYTDSRGLGELREILAAGNPEFGMNGYSIPSDNVFIGPGVSGVARALFTALMNNGDEVAIPKWSYIIYFAEAALSRAKVANVRLTESGQVDLNHLEDSINHNTKAVFITTVGNPLGVAISHESFARVLEIVNQKEREFNHPIWLVFDTIYENFRSDSESIDPIGKVAGGGRLGPTVDFYSISKTIAAPGARLGWMRIANGTEFKQETEEFIESLARLYQPTLGMAPVVFQMGLARLYQELQGSSSKRRAFDEFRMRMKMISVGRVRDFIRKASGVEGIVFPNCCYDGCGVNPDSIHSWYALIAVDKSILPRNGVSQSRQLADFLIDNPGSPILFTTPGDSFLANDLRGAEQEFMRAVVLSERIDEMVESVRRFVESKRKVK